MVIRRPRLTDQRGDQKTQTYGPERSSEDPDLRTRDVIRRPRLTDQRWSEDPDLRTREVIRRPKLTDQRGDQKTQTYGPER